MVRVASPRSLLTAVLACCALLALPGAAEAKRKGACANANAAPTAANVEQVRTAVLCLHNRERAARGLPRLTEHADLRAAAEDHSVHMVDAQFFSHDAPDGTDMVDRILGTGYAKDRGWSLGENIAWGSGPLATAAAVHRAWMRSPGHKANILRRRFREIGIGIALGAPLPRPEGSSPLRSDTGGQPGATYTADFGVRR
jgi:uncharacterized protein YkwD